MPTLYTQGEHTLIIWYRSLRIINLLGWIVMFMWVLALPNETEGEFALRIFVMLLGIAVIAPVFHGFIFRSDEPYHLFVFAGCMTIFSSFGLLSAPELSKILTMGWGMIFVFSLLAFLLLKSRQEKEKRVYKRIEKAPQPVTITRSEQPHSSPTWQRWHTYIQDLNQSIDQYEQYIQVLQPQLVRSNGYLLKLTAQPSYAQDPTSQGLAKTLTKRMGHQQLLLDWLAKLILHFRGDVKRLEQQQDNLEVANFLQDKAHLNELLLTERSVWNKDHYEQAQSLVDDLKRLDPSMTLQTHDLPADLQRRLAQHLQALKD